MTTRLMEDLNTPPNMAAAAHMAYTPGWMFQLGSHFISSRPMLAPKEEPTCMHHRRQHHHSKIAWKRPIYAYSSRCDQLLCNARH